MGVEESEEGRKEEKKIDKKGTMTKYNYKCGKECRLWSTSKKKQNTKKKFN